MSDEALSHHVDYFRRRYDGNADPWGFDHRWYERRKFALTVASLPRPHYERGYEPGCANGALTELLAPRCDELIADELMPEAAARATERLRSTEHVTVRCATFPSGWPTGSGDLVVLSEVAYYLTAAGRRLAERRLGDWLRVGGDVVAVHYTQRTDYPMSGGAVARWLESLPFLTRRSHHSDPNFELVVWRREPAMEWDDRGSGSRGVGSSLP